MLLRASNGTQVPFVHPNGCVCFSCMAVTLPALSFPLAKTALVLGCVMLRRVCVFTHDKNETLFVVMGLISVPDSSFSLHVLASPSAFGRTSTSCFHLLPSEAPAHIFASFNIFANSVSKTWYITLKVFIKTHSKIYLTFELLDPFRGRWE